METIAGKYRVIKKLGAGTSGTVYLVEHMELGMQYAIKVLNSMLSSDEKFIERFKQEAGVLSQFTHPGSVQLRDFGKTESNHYYMTMDYCDGTLLKELVDEGKPLEVERSLRIIEQTLNVLEAAHRVGIIHRDVKPDNIMLVDGPDGEEVRIMDFGIAKLKADMELDSTMTMEGASIGTPQYMSPEQAAGERDFDHRVDVYSAGIVLYQCLTGKLPFQGETILQTLLMQVTKPPRPFPEDSLVPQPIIDIVWKALEKDRVNRYSTAADFAEACKKARERLAQKERIPTDEVKRTAPTEVVAPESDQGKIRILCLDDDPMILNITKHILEADGYEAFTATDPSAIHDYIFRYNATLLISDVQMPGLPGTKVCQMLKKAMPDLKIILFSNIDVRDLERAAEESKADGWISKNDSPAVWLEGVKKVLGE